MANQSKRADLFLVSHGFAATRAEAQAAIRAGHVKANGEPVMKPAQKLPSNVNIAYQPAHPYVSRGAVKLAAALDCFGLSPQRRICLDIGASTGGFTQVLLERGASRVYAVDVGHGQLHAKLKSDRRVVSLEGLNARELSAAKVPEPPQAIVVDVSFISLKQALPKALALASRQCWAVFLVKPQFELGRWGAPRSGVVKDAAARAATLAEVTEWVNSQAWHVIGSMDSPIAGGDGNREYLLAARKDDSFQRVTDLASICM
jgi:23S rRNA (cytidine1920-2'-O)/16S rRNA (cytidine1409-2'-O)-methyltransferase